MQQTILSVTGPETPKIFCTQTWCFHRCSLHTNYVWKCWDYILTLQKEIKLSYLIMVNTWKHVNLPIRNYFCTVRVGTKSVWVGTFSLGLFFWKLRHIWDSILCSNNSKMVNIEGKKIYLLYNTTDCFRNVPVCKGLLLGLGQKLSCTKVPI